MVDAQGLRRAYCFCKSPAMTVLTMLIRLSSCYSFLFRDDIHALLDFLYWFLQRSLRRLPTDLNI